MPHSADEADVRTLVEDWAKAVRAQDMDIVLAHHSDDIVMFDVPMPLQGKGMEEYRKPGSYSLPTAREGRGH